jgi:precorrin-8X/cobalt-precorrin-8 methylmutase
MTLFTHYIAVDWSARNEPKRGKDSIWISEDSLEKGHIGLWNIRTRYEAIQSIEERIRYAIKSEQRLLIGFDFAFGYPAGFAKAVTEEASWRSIWNWLAEVVVDNSKNQSNRYAVAGQMNSIIGLEAGPFWGHPHQHEYANLGPRKPADNPSSFSLLREIEKKTHGAKSVFQLAYNGAVGSQTILGIASLARLISKPELSNHIEVWPFETLNRYETSKPITFAEIYPSSHKVNRDMHDILDAAQVRSVSRDMAYWDKTDVLSDKLKVSGLTSEQSRRVISEEGWILGQ